jgi:ADP-heptose:LPS heptosyltransferase
MSKFAARVLAHRGGLVGFSDAAKGTAFLYNRLLPFNPDVAPAEHEREALRATGLLVSFPFPTLKCVRDDTTLSRFNLETEKFIIVHFFAGNTGRSISPKKSRELLEILQKTLPKDVSLIISGSLADRKSALAISEGLRVKVVAGDTTLQEMMNLIKQSRAVISVDTGMAHIAAQLGKPLFVIRTCLGRSWWLPEQYGEDAPIAVFSHDDLCNAGHLYKDFPDCINNINEINVAENVCELIQSLL